jgi:hypothetical protein
MARFPLMVFAAAALLVPGGASAQSAGAGASPPTTTPPAPAGGPAVDADEAAPAPPAKPVVPATGYSFSGSAAPPPPDRPRARTVRGEAAGSDALMSGFETRANGGTRLFVELTRPVEYDARPTRGTITYVLKGAHVERRNNQNPLVTVHFNTPVNAARLVPHGRDLWFVVDLRANVQPIATLDPQKGGGVVLSVEFPKGEYLEAPEAAPGTASPAPSASGAPDRSASLAPR